jgi:hypothetical protein
MRREHEALFISVPRRSVPPKCVPTPTVDEIGGHATQQRQISA